MRLKIIVAILLLVMTAWFTFTYVLHGKPQNSADSWTSINMSCVTAEEHRVRGTSLQPVLMNGQEVVLLRGYYDCNPVRRGDIVAIKFKTRTEIFVKRIVGLPGDEVRFEGVHLFLNGNLLRNSNNQPYVFSERAKKILSIPLQNGKIPANSFLVLGEEVNEEDSFDSRFFGYISRGHIVGKVLTFEEWREMKKHI